ncbi:MAG: hypothetical protein IKP69_02285 [Oscillospiraceae bacterium]|nr:hypothetical protein [Oscillospiraceae bacterium]
MPAKYRIFDLHECYGTVSTWNTLEEARKGAEAWREYTHGKCSLLIQVWSERHQVYVLFENL